MSTDYCGICGNLIDGPKIAGEVDYKVIDGKQVIAHSDCYFAELGDEVEKHPIGRGIPHGGCGDPR